MTTPSPNNDDPARRIGPKPQQAQQDTEKYSQALHDTLGRDTSAVENHAQLSDVLEKLSPAERQQANVALGFLADVRQAAQSPNDTELPAVIGRYSIIRSLGRGGFAEVFLARDEELDRNVALKVPLFDAGFDEMSGQRFEREARLAASLGHPQIVPVYEYGTLGPVRFIAFAWCDGPALSQWISENKDQIDLRTAAQMVANMADAVQHAHQRGVVHRDLKPGNVLIDATNQDADIWDRLRIADFGLARNYANQETSLTCDGQIIGTPAYMAPEQAESKPNIGPAADIWALGMILFEMLTDQLPFRRPELLATFRAISEETAPSVRSIRKDAPAGLDAIIDLCLRKNPDDRYSSAQALSDDLRRWLNGQPIKARPQSSIFKCAKWTRRNPVLAGSLVLTLVSLIAGLAVAMSQRNVAVKNLELALAQTSRADNNYDTAAALISDVIELEQKMRAESSLAGERTELVRNTAVFQKQLLENQQQTPERRLAAAGSLKELSEILFKLDDPQAAIESAEYVLQLLEGLEDEFPDSDKSAQRKIFSWRFYQSFRVCQYFNLQGQFKEAIDLFEANANRPVPKSIDPNLVAMILIENARGHAMVYQMQGDNAKGLEILGQALEELEKMETPTEFKMRWDVLLTKCRTHLQLAHSESQIGDFEKAEVRFEKVNSYLSSLKEMQPNHEILKPIEGQLQWFWGQHYEMQGKLDLASKKYALSQTHYKELHNVEPEIPLYTDFCLQASADQCRVLQANEAVAEAVQIAKDALQEAAKYPAPNQNSASFKNLTTQLQQFVKENSAPGSG